MPDIDAKIVWFLFGLALMFLEFAAPGVVVIFFGFGAWVTAGLLWAGVIDSLVAQALVFCVSSFLLLFALRRWVKQWFVGDSEGGAGVDDEFLGKEVRVVAAAPGGGYGKVELKGAEWKARAEDGGELAEGALAEVVERDGLTLVVRAK